jgi:predicted MFS family arabinose efflux permease
LSSSAAGIGSEMLEGLRFVLRTPIIWKVAGSAATANLGSNIFFAVYLIFAYRLLHLTPDTIGIVFGIGAIGGVLGALSASWIARRLGLGPTLFVAVEAIPVALMLVLLAQLGNAVVLLIGSATIMGFALPIYYVNQVSLRQAITPPSLLGRTNATLRSVVTGMIPAGSLIGGFLGSSLSVQAAMYVGVLVATLAGIWILLGPITLRAQPAQALAE